MLKRIFIIFSLILSCIFFGGCQNKKPVIVFNHEIITRQNIYNSQEVFAPNQTIHYALIVPKGFKRDYLKLQVIKRPDNIAFGGASIYYGSDIFVNVGEQFYIDKFVLREEGNYVVRFFYASDTVKPIAEVYLWVRN